MTKLHIGDEEIELTADEIDAFLQRHLRHETMHPSTVVPGATEWTTAMALWAVRTGLADHIMNDSLFETNTITVLRMASHDGH